MYFGSFQEGLDQMDSCARQGQTASALGNRLWKQQAPAGAGQGEEGVCLGRNSIWGRCVVFIPPPVFPRLSRLCCCCCGAVPSMVVCPDTLWCQAVAGTLSGPKSKAETSVTFLSSSTVLVAWLFPHSAHDCSESGDSPSCHRLI